MSNLVSALSGAVHKGFVTVNEAGLSGMLTLRADLSGPKTKSALKSVFGLPMPAANQIETKGSMGASWMSPDELLLLCPYEDAQKLCDAMGEALAKTHHLVANVSDARAVFRIEGADVRQVLSKLAPVNFAEEAFPVGMFRRSRLAQAPSAFWFSDAETAHVICFRSQAEYVFGLLSRASQVGSEL